VKGVAGDADERSSSRVWESTSSVLACTRETPSQIPPILMDGGKHHQQNESDLLVRRYLQLGQGGDYRGLRPPGKEIDSQRKDILSSRMAASMEEFSRLVKEVYERNVHRLHLSMENRFHTVTGWIPPD
jgi:hypothetical protein